MGRSVDPNHNENSYDEEIIYGEEESVEATGGATNYFNQREEEEKQGDLVLAESGNFRASDPGRFIGSYH